MLKGGGGKTGFEVVLKQELEVLAILMGGAKSSHTNGGGGGGGGQKVYPVSRGGGAQTVSDPRFSHFVAPPPSP